jgi:5-methylcytosine-specific restriction enzyme subunit McrC
MTTVREFGGWTPVPLSAADVPAVKRTSRELKERLGLRETPLVVRTTPYGVQLKARHVAGFVQVGQATIEIAPKFLMPTDDSSWRDAFLAILARLGRLTTTPRVPGRRAVTGLPDLMGLVVDDALARASTEGLPRRYDERREELPALRGQLDVERLWRRFLDPEAVPCRFDVFTEDTAATRLLKWAARELSELVGSPALATQLRTHADVLRHVADELPSELVRDRIAVPPQYGYLDDAIAVARMLASGDALSMSAQEDAPARAFLWHTASVFEDFTIEVCRAAMFKLGGTVGKRERTLAVPEPGRERSRQRQIPTTPDVVVRQRGWTGLLDAKYKTLKAHPRTSDVYQVMAGGRVLPTEAVALVYPAWRSFQEPRTWRLAGSGSPTYLHALPLHLTAMADPHGFADLSDQMGGWLTRWRSSGGRSLATSDPPAPVTLAV